MARVRLLNVLCAIACAVGLAACGESGGGGGGGGGRNGPSGVLTIQGADALINGDSQSYTATLQSGATTTPNVACEWRSDNTTVLTIDGSGRATSVGFGRATITATHEAAGDTLLIHVFEDYRGHWEGDYKLTACRGWEEWCKSDIFRVGRLMWMEAGLSQQREMVSGTWTLGTLAADLQGAVADNARLNATSSGSWTDEGISWTLRVDSIDVRARGDTMTGSFTATMTAVGYAGHISWDGQLRAVVRTSSSTELGMYGFPPIRSLRDLLRAVTSGPAGH